MQTCLPIRADGFAAMPTSSRSQNRYGASLITFRITPINATFCKIIAKNGTKYSRITLLYSKNCSLTCQGHLCSRQICHHHPAYKTKRQSICSAFYHYRKYTQSSLCLFFLQYSLSGLVHVHLSHKTNLCINLRQALHPFLLQYLQWPFSLLLTIAFILPSSLSSLPAVW